MNSFRELYRQDLADITPSEELYGKTLRSIRREGRLVTLKPRRFAAVFTAAAICVIMCAAVYAANAFGIREYFGRLFGLAGTEMKANDVDMLRSIYEANTEDSLPSVTSSGTIVNEDSANGFMPPVTSNGTTMTPTAVIYEGSQYYLVLDITAPEGTVLKRPSDDYTIDYSNHGKEELGIVTEQLYSSWQLFGDDIAETLPVVTDSNGELIGYVPSSLFSNETGNNELTLILNICLTDSESRATVIGDGLEKNLTIKGLWLQSPDKVYTKVLEGNWTFDLETYGVSGEIPN